MSDYRASATQPPPPQPPPVPGFDLLPYRAGRIASRKQRCRAGFLIAMGCGLLAAFGLHWLVTRQHRAGQERRQLVEQRLLSLKPALDGLRVLEARIAADDARRARLLRLEPRRWQMVHLLDALGEAAQDGIAMTSVGFSRNGDGSTVARITGLSDDADAVARWASAFAGHTAIAQVEVDEVRRLETESTDRSRNTTLQHGNAGALSTFRITAHMSAPAPASEADSMSSSMGTSTANSSADQRS